MIEPGLIVVEGDVLNSGLDVVIHQANCLTIMGGGLAGTIAKYYPEAYAADKAFEVPTGEARLGQFSWAWVNKQTFRIFNAYGQNEIAKKNQYGRYEGNMTNVPKLEEAIRGILQYLKERNQLHLRIGLPYEIGCNLAGGDWTEVAPMLDRAAKDYQVPLYACRLVSPKRRKSIWGI